MDPIFTTTFHLVDLIFISVGFTVAMFVIGVKIIHIFRPPEER
jgi:hypothetical protein